MAGSTETSTVVNPDSTDLEAGAPASESKEKTSQETQEQEDDVPATKDENSEFVVWWDSPTDPENPMNWTPKRKWSNVAVMSLITFLVPLASSGFAPAVPLLLRDFHETSRELATFVVSIFVLGFAFGPLILAPLSEIYGRVIVYNVTNVLHLIFTILCAVSQNMGMILAARFLAGFAGVATITCGSGTIADIIPDHERGRAMAFWSLGPLMGPIVGPLIGGALSQALGWRWVFWLIAIIAGIATILCFFICRETYPVVILERKAARLRKETGNPAYRSKLALDLTPKQLLAHSIGRPIRMFFRSPIVAAMCIYIAVVYGLLYLLFTTLTFVFQGQYHFSTATAGLAFLGSGIGTLIGLGFVGGFSDKILQAKRMARGGAPRAEDRLPPILVVPASVLLPFGLIIYGWGADKLVHWIVPQIGCSMIGIGMIGLMMMIQTYLVDVYPQYAASVTAANAVLRSLLGALIPLGGLGLFDALGIGWGNTLLGLIALALAPIPYFFGIYGERIRNSERFKNQKF